MGGVEKTPESFAFTVRITVSLPERFATVYYLESHRPGISHTKYS